jgi:hypothetical protein
MELRSVIARTVHKYDISLEPGVDYLKLFEEIKDHFTAGVPRCKVKFSRIEPK